MYCAEDHSATKQNILHRHPIAFMPSPSWSSSSTWSNSPAAYWLLQSPAAVHHVPVKKVMCRTGLCTAQHAKNLSRACLGYAASSYNWLHASETRSHCVCHLQREGECCSDHNRHRSLWCYNAQNPAWHFLLRIGKRVRSCKCQRGRKKRLCNLYPAVCKHKDMQEHVIFSLCKSSVDAIWAVRWVRRAKHPLPLSPNFNTN